MAWLKKLWAWILSWFKTGPPKDIITLDTGAQAVVQEIKTEVKSLSDSKYPAITPGLTQEEFEAKLREHMEHTAQLPLKKLTAEELEAKYPLIEVVNSHKLTSPEGVLVTGGDYEIKSVGSEQASTKIEGYVQHFKDRVDTKSDGSTPSTMIKKTDDPVVLPMVKVEVTHSDTLLPSPKKGRPRKIKVQPVETEDDGA